MYNENQSNKTIYRNFTWINNVKNSLIRIFKTSLLLSYIISQILEIVKMKKQLQNVKFKVATDYIDFN